MVVVAYPLRCGDKDPIAAGSIDIVPAQGPAPRRDGEGATGEALARLLPGANLPGGSMGASFFIDRPRPGDAIRIAYPGGCGQSGEVVLPVQFTNVKRLKTPQPSLPAGQAATDRPVRLQALIDFEGTAQRIVYVGGPAALMDAAIDAVRGWTAEPAPQQRARDRAGHPQVQFGPGSGSRERKTTKTVIAPLVEALTPTAPANVARSSRQTL
jgi:hypothetical protein